MFFLALFAFALAASAMTALLLVLASRLLLGASLTFGSAFKAAFLGFAVLVLAALALQLAGIRLARAASSPMGSVLLPLVYEAFLVTFLVWLGKTTDDERMSLRRSAIAVVVASLVGFAIGWVGWKAYLPSDPAASRAGGAGQGFELPARSQICLRSLARILSDTGSGPKADAAREFGQRLEQDARSRGITMEEALKHQLRKFGARPPTGCDHLG